MIYALPIQERRKLTDNWTPPPPLLLRPDLGMHIYFASAHSKVLAQTSGHRSCRYLVVTSAMTRADLPEQIIMRKFMMPSHAYHMLCVLFFFLFSHIQSINYIPCVLNSPGGLILFIIIFKSIIVHKVISSQRTRYLTKSQQTKQLLH